MTWSNKVRELHLGPLKRRKRVRRPRAHVAAGLVVLAIGASMGCGESFQFRPPGGSDGGTGTGGESSAGISHRGSPDAGASGASLSGGATGGAPQGGTADESPGGAARGGATETGGGRGTVSGQGGADGGQPDPGGRAGAPTPQCDDCVLWAAQGCGSGRGCQPNPAVSASCTVCGIARKGIEGTLCETHDDCSPGHGCVDHVCRSWCKLDATSGADGACGAEHSCIDFEEMPSANVGACFRCDECNPTVASTCPGSMTCEPLGSCGACVPAGTKQEGDFCRGHSDCAHGLSCNSNVCRQSCSMSGSSGQDDCPASHDCVATSSDAVFGTCLPCAECALFGAPECQRGYNCVSSAGCTTCVPFGVTAAGEPCRSHENCAAGLACVDGACRQYCDLDSSNALGACAQGMRCLDILSETTVGMCVQCGECDVGTSGSCREGFVCREQDGCSACFPGDMRPNGSSCDKNGQCSSRNCTNGVCRSGCPSRSSLECAEGETCYPATSLGKPTGVCLPCGECNLVTQSGCSSDLHCLTQLPACSVCHPKGTVGEGKPCALLGDCSNGLLCANGVCRGYCTPGDPTSCPTGRCLQSSALPSGVGQCLPCGECTPWFPNGCGEDRKCDVYGKCSICEGNGSDQGEGGACIADPDCAHDLHCYQRFCRAYCHVGAIGSDLGACAIGRTCVAAADPETPGDLASFATGVCVP